MLFAQRYIKAHQNYVLVYQLGKIIVVCETTEIRMYKIKDTVLFSTEICSFWLIGNTSSLV